jgi:hypothetical protein
MAHDVFISYSSKNKQVADAICSGLELRKIRCWIAPRDVPPGGNYGEAIIHAIAGCKVVVLVYSNAVNLSAAVMREAERAMHHAKPIIPFRLEDVPMQPGLEFFLASCHWLDAINPPIEQHILRLGDAVEALMGREVAVRETMAPVTAAPPAKKRSWLPLAFAGAAVVAGGLIWKSSSGGPAAGTTGTSAATTTAPVAGKSPSMAVALQGASEQVIASHFQEDQAGVIRYRSSEDGGTLKIAPILPQKLPLLAGGSESGPFTVHPLFLEAKLMNPGAGTIFINTVTLKVESSEPVEEPLWYLDGKGLPEYVELAALGAGAPPQAKLQYKLAGSEDSSDLADVEPLARPDTGRWRLPLEKGKELLGKISAGDLSPVSFEVPKNPKAAPPAPPRPPASLPKDSTLLKLQDEGKDYTVQGDVSNNLSSGEGDRLFFWLTGDIWSRHRFKLVLGYDDGSGEKKSLESGWMEVELFGQ